MSQFETVKYGNAPFTMYFYISFACILYTVQYRASDAIDIAFLAFHHGHVKDVT